MQMQPYTLHNDPDGVEYTFRGEPIGFATSKTDDDVLRWTEITIYKTDTHKFVVHSLGCSDVFHKIVTPCASGEQVLGSQLHSEAKPCPICEPQLQDDVYFKQEVDRSNVFVSATEAGVVEGLLAKDADGVYYLTKTAQRALDDAGIKEREIAV